MTRKGVFEMQIEARALQTVGQFDLERNDWSKMAELGAVLREGRPIIIKAVVAAVVLALVYILLAPPVYRVDALVQVERPQSPFEGLEALRQELTGGKSYASSEIEIL